MGNIDVLEAILSGLWGGLSLATEGEEGDLTLAPSGGELALSGDPPPDDQ